MRARLPLLLGLAVAGATSARAQNAPPPDRPWWLPEPALAVYVSSLAPDPNGQALALVTSELTLRGGQLRPSMHGIELQLQFLDRFTVIAGLEEGSRQVISFSRARPLDGGPRPTQRTQLDVVPMTSLGVRMEQALGETGLRVTLGIGAGQIEYRLTQRGEFYDVPQDIRFTGDFRSGGTTPFSYMSIGGLADLGEYLDLSLDVRRQWGKAPMGSGFDAFRPLDLGGVRVAVGMVARRRRRQ